MQGAREKGGTENRPEGRASGPAAIANHRLCLLQRTGHKDCKTPTAAPSVEDLAERVAVGGWPGHLDLAVDQSLQAVRDYLEEIRRVDIGRVDQTRRDPEKVGWLLRSLARNVATYAANATLAADAGGAEGPLDPDTVREYLTALERLMVVEDQRAWAPRLRSKSRVRSAAKRHFVDPSLAVAALRATPERLLEDLNLLGFLFESLVVRDLRVYAQPTGAAILHYRDNTRLEVDAIVELPDGAWAAFEVKLGPGQVDEGAGTLQKIRRAGRYTEMWRAGRPCGDRRDRIRLRAGRWRGGNPGRRARPVTTLLA